MVPVKTILTNYLVWFLNLKKIEDEVGNKKQENLLEVPERNLLEEKF